MFFFQENDLLNLMKELVVQENDLILLHAFFDPRLL